MAPFITLRVTTSWCRSSRCPYAPLSLLPNAAAVRRNHDRRVRLLRDQVPVHLVVERPEIAEIEPGVAGEEHHLIRRRIVGQGSVLARRGRAVGGELRPRRAVPRPEIVRVELVLRGAEILENETAEEKHLAA